jgi:peptide methionine sulfoxide reductase msrA/msrB
MAEQQPATAILGGGCFWCTEDDLRGLPGVLDVVSGYSGGATEKPSYYDVASEKTGHREAVQVTYDPSILSYRHLLQFFIDHIDPTDGGGQFYDRGVSYSPAIFYATPEEQKIAESVLEELDASGVYDKPSAVAVLPRTPFYTAEEEHQRFAEKHGAWYAMYRQGSGHEAFVARTCQIREDKHIPWKE